MRSDLFIYPVCLLYSCTCDQFHSFSALTTEITLWWYMHVCQYVYVLCVFPHYGHQITTHFMLYATPFQFHFLSKIVSNFFLSCLSFPQQFIVLACKLSRMVMKEKGPYIIRVFCLPTDAQENCFKKNIKIYIKTAPTYFSLVTIRESII